MKRWSYGLVITSLGFGVACGSAPENAEETANDNTGQIEQKVGGNGNHPELVQKETISLSPTAQYPEVMVFQGTPDATGRVELCTATVIGPYAVLTASHCISPDGRGSIVWGSTSLPITASFLNPYLASAFRPSWWTTLNSQRTDGRTDDWPAMHDHFVALVPGLTPDFIAQNKLLPAKIAPNTPFGHYMLVGTASNGATQRQFLKTQWRNATAGSITTNARDGYLTHDGSTVGFSFTQAGDSGGPTFGSQYGFWFDTNENVTELDGEHVVVGTAQNGLDPSSPSYNIGGDTDAAPFAYTTSMTGAAMTANQKETVRLNHLWLRAMRDDPDGDGIPMACDSDSTNPVGSSSLCPAPVGMPKVATKTMPVGLLECNPGSFPVGIRGRSGALIDRLSLLCKPLSCFYRAEACTPTEDSDSFGWSGGGPFTDQLCPAGQIITGLETSVNSTASDAWLSSIRIGCSPLSSDIPTPTYVSTVAGVVGPVVQHSTCLEFQAISGIEVRAMQPWVLSGLQAVCNFDLRANSGYGGGYAGTTSQLRCPTGSVAVGTIQKSSGWVVDHFGIACAPKAKLAANQAIQSSDIFIAHARYFDVTKNTWFPPRVVPLSRYNATLPGTLGGTLVTCGTFNQTGWKAVLGLRVHGGDLLDRVDALQCGSLDYTTVSNEVTVGIGGTGGGAATLACKAADVTGFFAREQDKLGGLALHCGTF